jgi:tRNA1Val (adenine37-N6)-methyltransferase
VTQAPSRDPPSAAAGEDPRRAGKEPAFTEDTLLGGRLRYRQPAGGYRTGLEPVLLAASVPARERESVLEVGTGAGAALLCLGARLPGVRLFGIERDPALAALARHNLEANGFAGRGAVVAGDLLGGEGLERLSPLAPFDHVCANPPWHEAKATPSPDPLRRTARQQPGPTTLRLWIGALLRLLRPRGSITLILSARLLGEGIAALDEGGAGAVRLFPLWPHAGEEARLILLQARKGSRGPAALLPGLVLHETSGAFTEAAEAVLRHASATPLGETARMRRKDPLSGKIPS